MRKLLPGICAGLCLLIARPAMAELIDNGSFELPVVGGTYVTHTIASQGLTGWTIAAGSLNTIGGSVDQVHTYWQPADGLQSIDLDGSPPGTTDESAKIYQDIATTVGQKYRLSYWLSGNPDGGDSTKTVAVSAGTASVIETYDTVVQGTSRTDMNWVYRFLDFTATSPTTTITFDSSTPGWYGPALDGVSVVAVPVPAAAWIGMMLFAGIGLTRKLRRRDEALAA